MAEEQPHPEFKGKRLKDYVANGQLRGKLFLTENSEPYIPGSAYWAYSITSGKDDIFKVSLLAREQAHHAVVTVGQTIDYRYFSKEEFLRLTKVVEDTTFVHVRFMHWDTLEGLYLVNDDFSKYIPLERHQDDREIFLMENSDCLLRDRVTFDPEKSREKTRPPMPPKRMHPMDAPVWQHIR